MNSLHHQRSDVSHSDHSLMLHKIQQQMMQAGELIDGVPFPVLRSQEMPKHELVRGILEGCQGFGVRRVDADFQGARGDQEDVLRLQRGGEAGKVQDRVQHLRGGVFRDEGRKKLQELRHEGYREPGQNLHRSRKSKIWVSLRGQPIDPHSIFVPIWVLQSYQRYKTTTNSLGASLLTCTFNFRF